MRNPFKCYIAGKIGDLPEHEYKNNFIDAKNEVAEMGMIPVSPVDLPHEHDRSWKSYMKEDLASLKNCTAIYALRNWTDSRGARIEVWFAKRYNKSVIFQP